MNKLIIYILSLTIVLGACKKKVDPIDGSNATITLINAGANYVTENVTINPGDSVFFKYNVSSNTPMRFVSVQKNPVNQTAFLKRDTLALITSHSGEMRFKGDTANGNFIYRVVAHDVNGVYIGHKDVIVTTVADFTYYTFRVLRVPDTLAKTNACYMDAFGGNVYSYSNGAAASANIDFGLMYDTTGAASSSTTDDLRFCLYSLSAAQGQLNYYDISTWTKNITVMKKITSPGFNTLTSGGIIRTTCNTNLASGTLNKITQLVAGNMVAFRTAAGKRGILIVNFANGSSPAMDSYLNIDVKIEK
jgi:hypothetical protein